MAWLPLLIFCYTVKPVLSSHSKRRPKLVIKTNYCLMQVKSIAECSKGSILQYFRPSFSYHLSLRSLFCLFLSDRSTQFYWTILFSGESAVLETIKNAIKSFTDLKILDAYSAGNLRILELNSRYNVKDRLNQYLIMLGALRP